MAKRPEKVKKIATTSLEIKNESLEKLRSVFPQFVKDGQVDFDAVQAFFEREGLVAGSEKYGLNWAGKSNAFKAIQIPATGTLVPEEKESKNWDTTENLFIEGDNLEVLKLLQQHYREKIKMIYIDPPYNTGKDFVYKDNFTENVSDYYERTGQSKDGIKLTSNPESSGRYHSDWLTMMYPRLFLARNLLKNDGVIFISIDDNEVANLRLIMDEIFGEENLVGVFIWKNKAGGGGKQGKNDPAKQKTKSEAFVIDHEYIICYAKAKELIDRFNVPLTEEEIEDYINLDNDPRGSYKLEDLERAIPTPISTMYYPLVDPDGIEIRPKGGRFQWRRSKERVMRELTTGEIIWVKVKNKSDNRGYYYRPKTKQYLYDVGVGDKPETRTKSARSVFFDLTYTRDGAMEFRDLFGVDELFDNPKPTQLLVELISYVLTKEGIVLDFFAGSGTTAQAVMELNLDGGNRKWICVQLPEETKEGSEARKAGFKNIAEIARERIRRAGDKIGKGDIGFKSLRLEKSNYRQWNVLTGKDNPEQLLEQSALFAEKPLVDKYDPKSVVYEILLKEGFDLNAKVSNKSDIWIVEDGDRKMVISLAKKVTKADVEKLKLAEDDTFVCFDSALDDTTKVNIVRNFNVKVI